MGNFQKYIKSFSTQLGWFMGILYYVSYATPTNGWRDVCLIEVSIFIAFFAPYYSKFSNRIDEKTAFYSASVFVGRLARFSAQLIFNIIILSILSLGKTITSEALSSLGGVVGISLMISLTSQGIQYLAIAFSNRDIGNKNFNIIVSMAISILIGALAAQGFSIAQTLLEVTGVTFGLIGLGYSLFTDTRGIFPPKGGVGIFFGTFNPVHKTHVKLMKDFIRDRNLEKLIVHPTLIPKAHRLALDKGQIRIKEQINGMRVYETTERADVHVNYFMTGNKFYEVEHRLNMLQASISEEGLENVVEVWDLTNHYNTKGFYAIIAEIKRKFPNKKLHGLHGSDVGGMLVRAIYDESFGIIPYAVKRKDNISATAIRNGQKGMTTHKVESYINKVLMQLVS